jgi:NADPH:quinone reductase
MPLAIVIHEPGGPDVLLPETVAVGDPREGELRVRQTAIGVNFHDVYVRSGLYRTLRLPGIPGIEAAGLVEAVGPGVDGFSPGDRIAYFSAHYGAYAEVRLLRAEHVLHLPDGLDDRTAAAALVKGLTAQILLRQVHRVDADDCVLIHAASGGVGRLLCQWARHLGATVIATVGSEAKAAEARRCGAGHTILYRDENFVERVRDITNGRGVEVAYDSVGRDTFAGSMECLALRGHLVNFGQSSGPVEPFQVALLSAKSNTVSRPILFHYTGERATLEAMAAELFQALSVGILDVGLPRTFPLAEASEAHRALEARQTSGSVLLIPPGGG